MSLGNPGMDKQDTGKAGLIAFLVNVFLFIIKLFAGLLSGSLAILSDAFNSFMDILSYLIVFFSIKLAQKGPDADHPFGHRRAEPLSALLIGIISGVLAFEIMKAAVDNVLFGDFAISITPIVFGIVLLSILLKFASYIYLRQKASSSMSTSLEAISIDSRNDVFASSIVLIGIIGVYFDFPVLDDAAAILIAFYILYSGYSIARKNIDYLMGAKPEKKVLGRIRKAAKSVKGLKRLSSTRAHYVGDRVHVEISITLDKKLTPKKTHDIGERVQKEVEKIDVVSRAFVHIDYE
ncbi:cation diffusion facilitator family transporter [Candidatus Micrarchaeota archaeon]|nr:cation diffusion facilitator family transporter [Candidatus Micrarchaeota archaeon]MBD3418110.1 cation diffusion facilitator family transporter [Candidatus Micrarchaeota archaeon]